ncbi:hypothetical protein FQZ97_956030 [compost metagenome]
MLGHVPFEDVADRVRGRAAVVVDHALGVAGGAAGVVERDGVPLVRGQAPGKSRVASIQESFIGAAARGLRLTYEEGVFHVDHQQGRLVLSQRERLAQGAGELRVHDDDLGFAVVQHESNRVGVEPGVERVEHGARHGHAKVRFDHRRCVGQHHGHRVVLANAGTLQGAGQLPGAVVGLAPGLAQIAVHDGQPVRVDLGRALDEGQR